MFEKTNEKKEIVEKASDTYSYTDHTILIFAMFEMFPIGVTRQLKLK